MILRPMPRNFSMPILDAYGGAREALAKAGERLALSAAPDLLTAYIRATEREALAWLDGESFIADQMAVDYGTSLRAWRRWPFTFVRMFDRPLPSKGIPLARHIETWLDEASQDAPPGVVRDLLGIDSDRLATWERQILPLTPLPRLIAGADLAAAFTRIEPLAHGNPVAGVIIAERYCLPGAPLSAGGIAAIGLRSRQIPWRALVQGHAEVEYDDISENARNERCRLAWLEALSAGADAVIAYDKRLRLWFAHLEEISKTLRKSSHLRDLALMAGPGHSITVTRAAQALGLSRQATTRLVAQACERHLLREVTYGGSFRRYVIAV